jgi:hypothetical protein
MSDDDDDLKDLDPNNLDSIVSWSRKHQFRSRSSEEPQAQPERKQQRLTESQASAQVTKDWQAWIDQRISAHVEQVIDIVADETIRNDDLLRDQLRREIKEKVETKPRIILYDPQEAMKKQIQEFAAPLLAEVAEIRKELGLRQKGEVLDLPSLPRRRA